VNRAERANEAMRQQKEAKQKKLLFVLVPVFLALVAWQGPGILKALKGSPPPDQSAQTQTLTSTAPTTADPTGAAPSTVTPADPGAPVAPANGTTLPNTDGPATPGQGQLVSFDRFLGKDPFLQQVEPAEQTAPPPADNGGPTVTPVPSDNDTGGGTEPSGYTTATVSTNGVKEELAKGDTFPESEPIFRLVSISKSNVKIGLVSGSFSGGQETVTVKVGKTVTLVSQPDGIRYVIKLVKVA
jgi:hypothetical protein